MATMIRWRAALALTILALLAACQDRQAQLPTRANFTAAVTDYLAQRGHLCLAKYDWPIVVTQADRQAGSLAAQQMALLETLGLATAPRRRRGAPGRPRRSTTPSPARANTAAPTAAGQKYYLHVPVVVATATQHVTHPADFCVGAAVADPRVRLGAAADDGRPQRQLGAGLLQDRSRAVDAHAGCPPRVSSP